MSLPKEKFFFLSLVGLLLTCYAAFFHNLGGYALWDPDEGRTAVIAKEIWSTGNWLTLSFNGAPYYDKPAPYFWLVAIGLKLFGPSEWAIRWPSALAAVLMVGAVFQWGRSSGGWGRGLWAGLVLATSMEFVFVGRLGRLEMPFNLFFTAAMLSFLAWRERGGSGLWLFYLFMALACLIKGPVGIILPLLIIGSFALLTRRWETLREMRWLKGLGLILLIAGPWYLLAAFKDPIYMKTFLWDHNVVRFFATESGIKHPEPIYFFFPVLLGGFLPWSLFLPAVVRQCWRERKEKGAQQMLFLSVWAAVVFIFFSLARNKLAHYILPAFPPLALLTAGLLEPRLGEGEARGWERRWVGLAAWLWLILLVVLFPVSETIFKRHYPQYLSAAPPLWPAAIFILLAAAGWLLRKEKWTPWLVVFSSIWLMLWFYGTVAEEVSEWRGTRSFARMVNALGVKGYRVMAIRAESFAFYLDAPVQEVSHPGNVEEALKESKPTIALIKEKHLEEIRLPPSKLFVWKAVPSGSALIANFPLPPAQNLGRALKD